VGYSVEGDRWGWGGPLEKRGREVYRWQEYRSRKVGFLWWQEVGATEEKHATLGNILQSKRHKEVGAIKNWASTGIKENGKWEV